MQCWYDIHSLLFYLPKQVLEKTLDTYDASEIFLSFNGGKDCTALLHLFIELFSQKYPNEKLLCLYIQPEDPFDEIEDFIRECERKYGICVESVRGTVKGALFEICEQYPQLKACVMGCRRTDPYCGDLNEFQVSWIHYKFESSFNHTFFLLSFRKLMLAGRRWCVLTHCWNGRAKIFGIIYIMRMCLIAHYIKLGKFWKFEYSRAAFYIFPLLFQIHISWWSNKYKAKSALEAKKFTNRQGRILARWSTHRSWRMGTIWPFLIRFVFVFCQNWSNRYVCEYFKLISVEQIVISNYIVLDTKIWTKRMDLYCILFWMK